MTSLIFRFLVMFVVSAGFIAMGSLMLFWPTTYWRWAGRSATTSWWTRGWDENHRQARWGLKIVGVGMTLFGIVCALLTVWIYWFQR